MAKPKLNPVKENRAYVKGMGACVNIDSTSYNARLNKIRSEQAKTIRITELESELSEIKDLLKQVLQQVKN